MAKRKRLTYWLPSVKQLPFRSALTAKLHLILSEYGNANRAAKQMGLPRAALSRWILQDFFPDPRNAALIDEHYFICWERRELRNMRKKEQRADPEGYRAKREIEARLHSDAAWRAEAQRQAINGTGAFFEPPPGTTV